MPQGIYPLANGGGGSGLRPTFDAPALQIPTGRNWPVLTRAPNSSWQGD